jgi:hypothetical protein
MNKIGIAETDMIFRDLAGCFLIADISHKDLKQLVYTALEEKIEAVLYNAI